MPFPVRRARALIVTACLAATVGAPGSALAQSAGDDQYQDPLAGTTTQTAPPTTSSTPQLSPSAGSSSGSGSSTGSGTAADPVATTTGTGTGTTGTAAPAQATATSLPNTGVDGRIVAGLGVGLLLCGVGLRLRTARERF